MRCYFSKLVLGKICVIKSSVIKKGECSLSYIFYTGINWYITSCKVICDGFWFNIFTFRNLFYKFSHQCTKRTFKEELHFHCIYIAELFYSENQKISKLSNDKAMIIYIIIRGFIRKVSLYGLKFPPTPYNIFSSYGNKEFYIILLY